MLQEQQVLQVLMEFKAQQVQQVRQDHKEFKAQQVVLVSDIITMEQVQAEAETQVEIYGSKTEQI